MLILINESESIKQNKSAVAAPLVVHTELDVGFRLKIVELTHLGPAPLCKVSQFHAQTLVHQKQAIEIRLVDIQGPNAVLKAEGLLDLGSQLCQSLWN